MSKLKKGYKSQPAIFDITSQAQVKKFFLKINQ